MRHNVMIETGKALKKTAQTEGESKSTSARLQSQGQLSTGTYVL